MRKIKWLAILLLILFAKNSTAQTETISTTRKPLPSIANINTMGGGNAKGWFYKMDEDNIYLLTVKKETGYFRSAKYKMPDLNERALKMQIDQINTIAFQKKNAEAKSMLIGLGIGVVSGTIIGFASGDDPPGIFSFTAGAKATIGAMVLGGLGSFTGFIISKVAWKKYLIGGKKETFKNMQGEMIKRLIVK